MDIFAEIESKWTDSKPSPGVYRPISFYPSAAMSYDLERPGRWVGACLRAEWYRCKKYEKTDPSSVYSEWIMAFGKHLEVWLIEKLKETGHYVNSNMKFNFPSLPYVSGEIDILIKEENGELAVIENKTYNGSLYHVKKKIAGSGGRVPTPPTPKDSNVMQSFIYLHALSSINKVYLTYIDRSAGGPENHVQFDITNHNENELNFPKYVCKRPFGTFEKVIRNYTIESILDAYNLLLEHLKSDRMPDRSYSLEMSDANIQERFLEGEISKTKYEAYSRNPSKYPISDWQCEYCNYKTQCINDGA